MSNSEAFVDIHCHLLPGIDDGPSNWGESLSMARMAVADGIVTVVATPHQLGNHAYNTGHAVRALTAEFQALLQGHQVPLRVLPGAGVRVEMDLPERLRHGDVLTLGDHGQHVLLELPYELYVPLERLVEALAANRVIGILAHPERNAGILARPAVLLPLVDAGCLMQIAAGSLLGDFGPATQKLAEWMVEQRLVHFVGTDGHGTRSRQPLLRTAFERVALLADRPTALDLFCRNPASVAEGKNVPANCRTLQPRGLAAWLSWKKAG